MLNLIVNESSDGKNDKEGYITLEFRQNAYDDDPLRPGQGLVSFKLDKIADQIVGKTGLNIRVKSLYDGERYITIDFKKTKTNLSCETLFSIPFYRSGVRPMSSLRFIYILPIIYSISFVRPTNYTYFCLILTHIK